MTGVSVGAVAAEVEGQGVPVVFIHGLGGTSNTFQPMLEAFGSFRCIRPDLPGSGRSPRPHEKLTIAHMVGAVVDTIKAVAGAPAHLVGHSLGTLVAQQVAVAAPEWALSLTLFGPIVEPGPEARERLRARAQTARRSGMIAVAEGSSAGLSTSSRGNPLAVAFLRESHMRQDAEGFAQTCEALAEAERADLRLLSCPVSIATGDEDGVAPPSAAQALADKLKGAKLKVFDRCGHWTPIERPKECGRLAADFLRSVEA